MHKETLANSSKRSLVNRFESTSLKKDCLLVNRHLFVDCVYSCKAVTPLHTDSYKLRKNFKIEFKTSSKLLSLSCQAYLASTHRSSCLCYDYKKKIHKILGEFLPSGLSRAYGYIALITWYHLQLSPIAIKMKK